MGEIPTIRLIGCSCSLGTSKGSHTYANYRWKQSKYLHILVCKKCGKSYHVKKMEALIKSLDENDQVIWSQGELIDFIRRFDDETYTKI